jgi:hypothetical protein
MSISRARRVLFAAFSLAAVENSLLAAEPTEKPSEIAKAKITIGKETTYITEPLRPDGYPDYFAALNKRFSEGVTPENNAAALLAKVFGPVVVEEVHRKATYTQLGIEPLPKDGKYLVSQEEMLRRRGKKQIGESSPELDAIENQFGIALERPWSREEFPVVAEWIDANETPLALAVEASKRPRYFWPYMSVSDSEDVPTMIATNLAHVQEARQLANLLATRAMLRIGSDDPRGAWQDILACHRLARMIGSGGFLVEALVGIAIEGIAANADVAFAHYGKLSAAQANGCQANLKKLPRVCDVANSYSTAERFCLLDSVAHLARDGRLKALMSIADLITSLSSRPVREDANKIAPKAKLNPNIDWNVPMKFGNQWYDRLADTARIKDPRERTAALARFDAELKGLNKGAKSWPLLLIDAGGSSASKDEASQRIAEMMVALFMPAMGAVTRAEDRTEVTRKMAQVAFALAAYRAEQGSYPEKLETLVPKYLAKVPDDSFKKAPGPVGYRREGDGYVMWTVHINGIDEMGATPEDNPTGDDYVFRPVPRAAK